MDNCKRGLDIVKERRGTQSLFKRNKLAQRNLNMENMYERLRQED